MASVRSLGLHHPSGLRHAINEQLLPANSSPSSYSWDIITDNSSLESVEDELLIADNWVIWCRGGIFRKTFKFDLEKEPIVHALVAYFPVSEYEYNNGRQAGIGSNPPIAGSAPAVEKALVVFLKTQAHIFFLSGTSHIVHMPFEVESACAGPVGVIIQRKQKTENVAPIQLRFPRVPPNSFVSSQLTAFNSSQRTAFSIEGFGKPKSLHFEFSSTLENMWDAPLEQQDSHWPRLVSLTDPLSDIGLIIGDGPAHGRRAKRGTKTRRPSFLDPAEEILHIEKINIPGFAGRTSCQPLILGVTVNRENASYTIWRLSYLDHEDPFIGHRKKAKGRMSRRRSSMPPPAFPSGTSTPVQQSIRDSFGVPLPGKKQRKSEMVDKPIDLVTSLEQQDNEVTGGTRRSSRRLSSMLARADLSASHERSVFADQPLLSSSGVTKRNESFGNQQGRSSSGFNQIHPSLGSLLEAPIDVALDESLHNMGLDDHDFDGLQHEIQFTKIQTISIDSSNVRYSSSTVPARSQAKVFILTAPSFAVDEQQRTQLLIGIQEPVEKRLQMMTLFVKPEERPDSTAPTTTREPTAHSTLTVSTGGQWKVQNVVDSSKLMDGDLSVILVLSDSQDGEHELSAQAPWVELTKISLSLLFVDDTRSIQYRGRVADRDVKQRKSEVMDLTSGGIVEIRHPRKHGVIDIVDANGRFHQLKIQLQSTCLQVRKVLEMCKSVLPEAIGGRIHAGWLHVMQWLQSRDENLANTEWSALAILLLGSFLNLGREEATPMKTTQLPVRKRRPASGSFGSIRESEDWRALEMGETANSLGYPVWMMNNGWQWALEEDAEDLGEQPVAFKFLSKHIAFAKEYLGSPSGEAALGPAGYLPMALSKPSEFRRKVAVDLFMAMHLLLDEQKLDITTPEYASPGRADLRVLLCQIARWLRWHSFSSIYELGIQEDVDPRHDNGEGITLCFPDFSALTLVLRSQS